jgi:hypothetical protein
MLLPSYQNVVHIRFFLGVKQFQFGKSLVRKLSTSTIPNVYHMKVYAMMNLMILMLYSRCWYFFLQTRSNFRSFDFKKILYTLHFSEGVSEKKLSVPQVPMGYRLLGRIVGHSNHNWYTRALVQTQNTKHYRLLIETKKGREDYGVRANSNTEKCKQQWTSLWIIQVPSKLKVFLWRLARLSLPTAATRHPRNMADSPWCGLCGATVDTWRHALHSPGMFYGYISAFGVLCDDQLTEHVTMTREKDAKAMDFLVKRYS